MEHKELFPTVKGGSRCCAKCVAITALLCAWTASADPVDWTQYERSFNISFPGYSGSETLSDFPVLIRLSAGLNDFRYNKCKVQSGGDLRFSDESGNLLASEIDTWDESGTSLVWVRVPSLNAATKIKAYYGCSNPVAVNPKDVWSNGYVGVWHLGEGERPLRDSTANGFDFTASSTVSGKDEGYYDDRIGFASGGVVGKSVAFGKGEDSRGGLVAYDKEQVRMDGYTAMTLEVWTCEDAALFHPSNNLYCLAKWKNNNSHGWAYQVYDSRDDHRLCSQVRNDSDVGVSLNPKSGNVQTPGTWAYSTYVYDAVGGAGHVYLNGNECSNVTGTPSGSVCEVDMPLCLGNRSASGDEYGFPGSVDELRISSIARSADWVKATYDTVKSESFAYYDMDNDWKKYTRKFQIRFEGAPADALTDFPVLVKLSEYDATEGTGISNFLYSAFAKLNGGDLRFSDENGQLLDHEIDTWDENGVSYVWVKIPTLSSTTKITAYYGWKYAPAVNSKAVWSNGYVGVWHLGESARPLCDSSSTGIDFTTSYDTSKPYYLDECNGYGEGGGAVGNALRVGVPSSTSGKNGRGGLLAYDPEAKIGGFSAMTVEIWAKPNDWDSWGTASDRFLFSKRLQNNPKTPVFYAYYAKETVRPHMYFGIDKNKDGTTAGFGSYGSSSSNSMTNQVAEQWYYHAIRFDRAASNSIVAFLNGSNHYGRTGQIDYDIISYADPLCLGNNPNATQTNVFLGCLDEFRISNVARSAAWIKATYDTIKNNATFTTYDKVKDNSFHPLQIYVR